MNVNPYQAPTAAPPPPTSFPSGEPYVDQGGRVRVLGILLIVGIVASVLTIGSTWLEIDLLERAKRGVVDLAEAEANDSRQVMLALGTTALFILTAVIFAMFLHRSNKNAQALTGGPLSVTPGWTIGWFFVPFANLFKPYQAVREIWEQSKGAVPAAFTLWWVAYIGSGVLAQISFRTRDVDSLQSMLTSDWIAIGQEVVSILSAVLALWMVRALHEGQQRHHQTGKPDIPTF